MDSDRLLVKVGASHTTPHGKSKTVPGYKRISIPGFVSFTPKAPRPRFSVSLNLTSGFHSFLVSPGFLPPSPRDQPV